MTTFRQDFLRFVYPAIKVVGKLHWPYTHKQITADLVEETLKVLKVGDVLCSTAYGEISNWVISGTHKHASVYVGDGRVVEAVGVGVREINIYHRKVLKAAFA